LTLGVSITSSDAARYRGKPLLGLLELYVLWAIDQLSEKQSSFMVEITPKLQSIYLRNGTRQNIIEAEIELPSDLPNKSRELWIRNRVIAHKQGVTLSPQEFAEMFVDQNLAY
jgi:hypothetical protein